MKRNIARASALGTIGIGVLSAVLSGGCAAGGGDPNTGSSEPVGKSSQPIITPVSLTTNGCNAVGTFNITSPQVISFIAANTQAFQNAQMQLFMQTVQGSTTQVNTTAQAATAEQKAVFQAASQSSASQEAAAQQSIQNSAASASSTNASATEQDTTTVSGMQTAFSNSDTTVIHHDESNASASGNATNSQAASNSASNSANGMNGASNSAQQSFLASAMQSSLIPAFFGGIVTFPSSSSSSSSQTNANSALSNAFFNNAAAAASSAAASQASAFQNASHTDNTTVDQTDQDTKSGSSFSQTVAHQLQAANGTSATNAASNSSDVTAASSNKAKQAASNSSLQDNSTSSSSSTQVFNDLETLNSNNFNLVVNLTASQVNNVLQLFQGSNGVVTSAQTFPVVIPTCVGVN